MTMELSLCTYNILAPCWADLSIYPQNSHPYIDKQFRRNLIINTLKQLSVKHDIIALQETQDDELPFLISELNSLGFSGFHINHKDDYWAKYITIDPPFVSNGVALFWKSENITMLEINGYDLSTKGNRCIMGKFKKNNKIFRIVCVHLDTDTGGARAKEAKDIIEILPKENNVTDIILGDFNFNTEYGPYNNIFKSNRFLNLLKVLGKEDMTHPFDFSYAGNNNYGSIDHILFRGNNVTPVDGEILDFNVWKESNSMDDRISLLLQKNGSDHFIVTGKILCN